MFFQANAFRLVGTLGLVGLLLWFPESARGSPTQVLFSLCSMSVVWIVNQFHWKLSFVFATRILFVSQLLRLLLLLQLPMSPKYVVLASPQIVSAKLPSLFCCKLSFAFAQLVRILLVSQLPRLFFGFAASKVSHAHLSFSMNCVSNTFCFSCLLPTSSHESQALAGI